MAVPISVLFVKNSHDEVVLLLRALRRGGYDPVYARVDTPGAMAAALDRRAWDVILADANIPRFSGLAALKLVKDRRLETPFIIVSGRAGEEFAVEAMKAGVHDYIIKNRLGRLVPAIKRELRETGRRREHKRTELELRQSEKKYRQLVELAQEGIWVIDHEARTTFVNPRMAQMLGYTAAEMINRTPFSFVEESFVETWKTFFNRRKQGLAEKFDFIFIRKDGARIHTSMTASPIMDDDGNFVGSMALVADITGRKIAEMKVNNYKNKLRSLAAKLSLAEERERRRIASDIHDHIGQSLAVAKMELEALKESLSATTFEENVGYIKNLIEKTIHYTRSLTFEISPPVLYELGFEAAVEWLGEQIIEKRGVQFRFESDGQWKPLDDEIQIILFTAVRELLINIVKHAEARLALVAVQKQGHDLHIRVEDDGTGFDFSKKGFNFSRVGGFGLFSVRERLKHLGGNMEIESMPGRGTVITMKAPLKR